MSAQQLTEMIPIGQIVPSKTNPRINFNEQKLKELSDSIKERGQLQAILVCKLEDGTFEIIAGERRWRASKMAGRDVMKCEIVELDEKAKLEVQLIENVLRDDLHPMEEAQGYKNLIDQHGYTVEKLAAKTGKKKPDIAKTIKLLNLTEEGQKAFKEDKFQLGHALLIARIEDAHLQDKVVKELSQAWGRKYTLKDTQEYIESHIFVKLTKAPFKIDDAELLPIVGACTGCEYNTDTNTGLFTDMKNAGMCSHPKCYGDKVNAFWKGITKAETEKGNVVLARSLTNKIFNRYSSDDLSNSEYVNANAKYESHPKKLTYKALLKGKIKEYIALDLKGKVRRLYKKSEINAAVKDEKWAKKLDKPTSNNSHSSHRRDPREDRRNTIADNLQKKKIISLILKRKLDKDLYRSTLLDLAFDSGQMDEDDFAIIGFPKPKDSDRFNGSAKWIKDFYATKSEDEQMKIDLLIMCFGTWCGMDNLAKILKVKASDFKAEAKKLEAKEFEDQKTAAKTTTPQQEEVQNDNDEVDDE